MCWVTVETKVKQAWVSLQGLHWLVGEVMHRRLKHPTNVQEIHNKVSEEEEFSGRPSIIKSLCRM